MAEPLRRELSRDRPHCDSFAPATEKRGTILRINGLRDVTHAWAAAGGRHSFEDRMDKVREFRQRARECRVAGARASDEELKGHYDQLAGVWEKLADERVAFFIENPDEQIKRAS
jgi:hypothetical protein